MYGEQVMVFCVSYLRASLGYLSARPQGLSCAGELLEMRARYERAKGLNMEEEKTARERQQQTGGLYHAVDI